MLELIETSCIEEGSAFAVEVDALLNDAFPDGAPNERSAYYARHGVPTTSMLLSDGGRVVGHLAIYERDIKIGEEALRVGLLGEIAIAADRRGAGLGRETGSAGSRTLASAVDPILDFVCFCTSRVSIQRLQAHAESNTFHRRGWPLENAPLPGKHVCRTARQTLAKSINRSGWNGGVAISPSGARCSYCPALRTDRCASAKLRARSWHKRRHATVCRAWLVLTPSRHHPRRASSP